MADTDEGEQTPAVIGKHMDQVRSRHDVEVVYVRHAVTSYNRKRLIEQKVLGGPHKSLFMKTLEEIESTPPP